MAHRGSKSKTSTTSSTTARGAASTTNASTPLRAALKAIQGERTQAREQAVKAQLELERHKRETGPTDAELFRQSTRGTKPLVAASRVAHAVEPPTPEPRQRWLDEQAALRQTWSDELDVTTLLDTDEALSFHRAELGPDVPRKLRRGDWAVQGEVDLHGMTREEAREALASFLQSVTVRGVRCVRVVHGKGTGSPGRVPVLKGKVRAWLVQDQRVLAFVQAPRVQGGNGAVLVLLR